MYTVKIIRATRQETNDNHNTNIVLEGDCVFKSPLLDPNPIHFSEVYKPYKIVIEVIFYIILLFRTR
jgi:hypothetical protein